jgi:ABC-type glycerol-3-phosphate transport system substrate-binding protein
MERDGKLYEMFQMFRITGFMAKTADAGKKPGWTLSEFAEFIAAKPDAEYMIGGMTKHGFIRAMVLEHFIDRNTGECRFDRGEFEKILEIAERFPAGDFVRDDLIFLSGLANGDPLMLEYRTNHFQTIKAMEIVFFDGEVTYMGIGSSGPSFIPRGLFAIADKAANPDGAWEFLKYMLDEYSDEWDASFPIKIADLEMMAKEAEEGYSYTALNGEIITKRSVISFNDGYGNVITLDVGDNTVADSAKVMNLILSTENVVRSDSTVLDILDEEIGAYLSKQTSSGEVADIIENRMNLYISESQ